VRERWERGKRGERYERGNKEEDLSIVAFQGEAQIDNMRSRERDKSGARGRQEDGKRHLQER
jgi:hypothetical protein